MSAFIGLKAETWALMFADGAAYDDQGILREVRSKIVAAEKAPFAMTGQGNTALLDPVIAFICQEVDRIGVDRMIDEFLPDLLVALKRDFEEYAVGHGGCAFQIVGYSPSKGAFLKQFQSIPEPGRPDLDVTPYSLRDLGATSIRGPQFPAEWFHAIRQPSKGEDLHAYLRDFGITCMEFMRACPSTPFHLPDGPKTSKVGGHIDMAIVDADGARVERIRTWQDEIGKLIDPDARIGA